MSIFCCKVSLQMPSSCPSSCSVSCISPCQQHCCQEGYPPIFRHSHLLSVHRNGRFTVTTCDRCTVVLRTIVIFNNIFNTKCPAKLFAAAKLCNTYTICPIFCSSYCSHSWPQYSFIGQQKPPYLFKTPEQTSPVGRSLAV